MKIYTSYFANVRNLPDGCVPISISRFPPKGWTGLTYPPLFPPQELLLMSKQGKIDNRDYILTYKHQVLDNLHKDGVVRDIEEMTHGRDAVLICYEKPSDFCHRKIVAKWMGIHEILNKKTTEETSLF